MMIIIMIMTIIFQAVTTIMLLFLEQVPQVNNGSRVYLPGLLEMNNYASKKTLLKMRWIAQEQENTDETVLFLRKWRRLSGQVSKKNTKTKQKIKESCTTIGSNNLKLTITNTIKDFKHTDKTQNENAKQFQFQFDRTGDTAEL